jgi:hypothetical protein
MPKIPKIEKSFGREFILIIILVVLVVAGFVTWQVTKKNSTGNLKYVINNSVQNSTCMKYYNDQAICRLALNLNFTKRSYEATGTVTTASGTINYAIQSDGKGNSDVSDISKNAQVSSIKLNGKTYIQPSANTTWLEYTAANLGSADTVTNPVSGFNINFNNNTPSEYKITKEGTAVCGNLTCDKYQIIVAAIPDSTQFIYFDAGSYLLRQWTSSNPSAGTSLNLTFIYPKVVIATPLPVKKVTN